MIIQNDVNLSQKTTMKIGGYADCFYIPENEEELIQIAQEIYDKHHHVLLLSGGSNLLINDEKRFEEIVYMGAACSDLIALQDGLFYIGASNRIQKVISFVNDHGYGGFEELIGLPALFGGVIYMNAGIGGKQNPRFTIGNFIETVKLWDLEDRKVVIFSADQCDFSHRHSVFQNDRYIILGAYIKCVSIDYNDAKNIRNARLQFCREHFEYGKGCFGTCFSTVNYRILKMVSLCWKMLGFGKGKVTFGQNNRNWLVNHGNGSYRDAMRIIKVCKRAHYLFFQKIECEIIIWN